VDVTAALILSVAAGRNQRLSVKNCCGFVGPA